MCGLQNPKSPPTGDHLPSWYLEPLDPYKDKKELHEARKKNFPSKLSVSYANSNPLWIVRGERQYLFDEQGVRYLDTRNNVPHVGHTHPKVVEAVCQQVSTLNTNTRYLHENMVTLSEKLLKTFGEGSKLNKVFFVNSGSEANDLALRLAEGYTKKRGVVAVQYAYHGHTQSVVNISPYKFIEQKPHISVIKCPNSEEAAEQSLKELEEAFAGNPNDIPRGAFFIESGMSVAGVIVPPQGYLERAKEIVHKHGGVCVADEVQTGFGRFGECYWGYQCNSAYEPDIVTMGKPFGNGMPLAAVVCTEELISLPKEYFNTYGGNPVCTAAGLAVLRVIETESLQHHAKETGEYFRERLVSLSTSIKPSQYAPYIHEVRGRGLFLGIEFRIGDEKPATQEASKLVLRLVEEHQILTSLDGPGDNVMVIKPPMCFGKGDVDTFIEALASILETFEKVDPDVGHTPT